MTSGTDINVRRREQLLSALGCIVILLIAAYFHWGAAFRSVVHTPLRADAGGYFFSAYNVATYGVFSHERTLGRVPRLEPPSPSSFLPPGYPAFLLLVGRPVPEHAYLDRVKAVQVGLGVATVLVFFGIASSFLPRGWSHAATTLVALEPHLQVMSGYFLTETLFTFLLFLSVFAIIRASRDEGTASKLVAGIVCGLCTLTRPTLLLLPWLLVASTLFLSGMRPYRRLAMLLLGGYLATILPWTLRNATVPVDSTQPSLATSFLLHGSYPGFVHNGLRESYGSPYAADPDADAARLSLKATVQLILGRATEEPVRYAAWYLAGKPGFFLAWSNIDNPVGDIFVYPPASTPFWEESAFVVERRLMLILHWPLMLMGLAGVALTFRPTATLAASPEARLAAQIVSAVVLYAICFHSIGAPYPRYGVPFRPLLFPLALLALQCGLVRLRPGAT